MTANWALAALAAAVALASATSRAAVAAADAANATPFSDDACPQANGPGRTLNGIDPKSPGANDAMLAAAQGLADAYRDCVGAYDGDVNSRSGTNLTTDYVVVHRSYARLQLARSLRRLAMFDAELQHAGRARSEYEAARKPLAEIESIVANASTTNDAKEGKMISESRTLRDQIASEEAALPAADVSPAAGASPAANPSATP